MSLVLTLNSYSLRDAERQLIEAALQVHPALYEAAKLLGISRHVLRRRMLRHGIPRPTRTLQSDSVLEQQA